MITKSDWVRYFPFSDVRPDQEEFINFALSAFTSGTRYVIGELPMGIGKSAIAVTIARYLANEVPISVDGDGNDVCSLGGYVLTTQKILQEQYLSDFEKFDMKSIKSSTNYKCRFYKDQSCAESLRVLTKLEPRLYGTPFFKQCKGSCAYKEAKSDFVASPLGVTNFSYFLAERMYGGALGTRQVLIADEAHNIEAEVAKFVALKVDPASDWEIVKIDVPRFEKQSDAFNWIVNVYKVAAVAQLVKLAKKIERAIAREGENLKKSTHRAMRDHESLDKQICKVNRFIDNYSESHWVFNSGENSLEFKPVDVSKHTDYCLFGGFERVLLLSATILDPDFYCRTLGIPRSQAAFKSCDSPFKPENRPIHYLPVGKMNAGEIDRTLPNLVEMVRELLKQHPDVKGVIHAHTFKIAQAIKNGIRDKRLLVQSHGDSRDRILIEHSTSSEPTVLVSPSMTEGVDLKDDLSRFQIFCKVPFPYLGDEYCKRKIEMTPDWYPYVTARTIIQASGRSIRNASDWATTYILDGSFEAFYARNERFFPLYFKKSVHM